MPSGDLLDSCVDLVANLDHTKSALFAGPLRFGAQVQLRGCDPSEGSIGLTVRTPPLPLEAHIGRPTDVLLDLMIPGLRHSSVARTNWPTRACGGMSPYTGRGDDGETDLRTGDRVSKANPRIEAYGVIDEVNALIGAVRTDCPADIGDQLGQIQNHLHVIQAELANPATDEDDPRISPADVQRLEEWIDTHQGELTPLDSFILPGGSPTGAHLHHARTVARRAERRIVHLGEEAHLSDPLQTYVNRLSDALFVFARVANARAGTPEESPTY